MSESLNPLSAAEQEALSSGSIERLRDAEARYGTQRAALDAHPELGPVAPLLQSIRAKAAADALGVRLRGDGDPFPPHILERLRKVVRNLL
jgi:hypothetical protein